MEFTKQKSMLYKKKKKEEQDIAGFLLGLALSLLISIKERNTGGIFAV